MSQRKAALLNRQDDLDEATLLADRQKELKMLEHKERLKAEHLEMLMNLKKEEAVETCEEELMELRQQIKTLRKQTKTPNENSFFNSGNPQMGVLRPTPPNEALSRAVKLMKEGADCLTRMYIFTHQARYDDAVAAFQAAAQWFVIAGRFEESAEALLECAKATLKLKDSEAGRTGEAGMFYIEAAEMMTRASPFEAMDLYKLGIKCLTDVGMFGAAARYEEKLGNMLLLDGEREDAVLSLWKAALYLRDSGDFIGATRLGTRAGKLWAELDEYALAMREFERCSKMALRDNKTSFNSATHLLRAAICALLKWDEEPEDVEKYLTQLKRRDYMFHATIECQFFEGVVDAMFKPSLDDFADHAYNFDNVRQHDAWMLTMLSRVAYSIRFKLGEISESSSEYDSDSDSDSDSSDETNSDEASSDESEEDEDGENSDGEDGDGPTKEEIAARTDAIKNASDSDDDSVQSIEKDKYSFFGGPPKD